MRRLPLALLCAVCACGTVTRLAAPSPAAGLSVPELQYRVVDGVGAPAYCDPLLYPVARVEDPATLARMVSDLRTKDPTAFAAIIQHEHLDAASLSPADDMRVLAQASELAAVPLSPEQGGAYAFQYQVAGPPSVEVSGTIDADGRIAVAARRPAPRRPCPV
jgi:hypothetical protein